MTPIVRVGQGYDLHRLVTGRPLWLAGVNIDCDRGLDGHSDADVAIHALIDALLGAAGLPDIGQQFPDTDPQYHHAPGRLLLQRTHQMVLDQSYLPVNVDLTIIAQAPKLGPHKQTMRSTLAQLLGLDPSAVSVKAKTNEGLGPVGTEQAIACHALASLAAAPTQTPTTNNAHQ